MSFPKAVYLDTCILRKLGKEITAPEYQEIKKICDILSISIYIPKLVLDELVHYHLNEKLGKKLIEAESGLRELQNNIISKEDISFKIDSEKIKRDFKKYLLNQIKKAGIEVIKTPNISLNVLLERAVKKVRPFKEKDKGFRDTIILYTVLKFAKNYAKGLHMLISEDGDFKNNDVIDTALGFGIEINIRKSLQEAKVFLEEFLKEVKRKYFTLRAEKLREFLITKRDKISSFVQEQGKFSQWYFEDTWRKQPFISRDLLRINKIEVAEPIDITKINMGFLPAEEKKGWVGISFYLKFSFFITVGAREMFWPQRFPVGSDKDVEAPKLNLLLGTDIREETFTDFVQINAEVLVDEDLKFYDLKFTETPGY